MPQIHSVYFLVVETKTHKLSEFVVYLLINAHSLSRLPLCNIKGAYICEWTIIISNDSAAHYDVILNLLSKTLNAFQRDRNLVMHKKRNSSIHLAVKSRSEYVRMNGWRARTFA